MRARPTPGARRGSGARHHSAAGAALSDEAVAGPPLPAPPAEGPVELSEAGLGRRNDRLLVGLIAGYIVLLSGLMIVRGVSLTPDVLLIGLGLAAILLGRGSSSCATGSRSSACSSPMS